MIQLLLADIKALKKCTFFSGGPLSGAKTKVSLFISAGNPEKNVLIRKLFPAQAKQWLFFVEHQPLSKGRMCQFQEEVGDRYGWSYSCM